MLNWLDRNGSFIAWLIAVSGIAVLICLYCQNSCQCYPYAYQHCMKGGVCGWLARTLGDPVSLFTGVLTIATIGMWYVMWKTLDATKRSVDSNIDGNRGRIIFTHGTVHRRRANTVDIGIEVRNVGNSAAWIHNRRYTITEMKLPFYQPKGPLLAHVKPPFKHPENVLRSVVLAPNETVSSIWPRKRQAPNILVVPVRLTPAEVAAYNSGNPLMYQFSLRYGTMYGEYEMTAALFVSGRGLRINEQPWTDDYRVTDTRRMWSLRGAAMMRKP